MSAINPAILSDLRAPLKGAINLEVVEEGIGASRVVRQLKLYLEDLPTARIKCSNPLCRAGGVLVAPLLREMLGRDEGVQLSMEMCPGRSTIKRRSARAQKCSNMFAVRLLLDRIDSAALLEFVKLRS